MKLDPIDVAEKLLSSGDVIVGITSMENGVRAGMVAALEWVRGHAPGKIDWDTVAALGNEIDRLKEELWLKETE